MSRSWLLTNTCYGTWLPGDSRGFVGHVQEHRRDDPRDAPRVTHNEFGSLYDGNMPGLVAASADLMKGSPVHLTTRHAEVLLVQFQETASVRNWQLRAVAIMSNHFHIVVTVPGDPSPSKILGDFKSWGTRTLTRHFGALSSETWWTERGSKRKLPDERAVVSAVEYMLYKQPKPLLTLVARDWFAFRSASEIKASVGA